MKEPLAFLSNQQLLTLATKSEGDIWIANMYFAIDDDMTMYFVSPTDSRHSQMIIKNAKVAFSTAWFDTANHKNRKSVQGSGECYQAKNIAEITTGIQLLYKKFPDLAETLTLEWIMANAWGTKVWVLKPTYIKYWDDEMYGGDESREFTLSSQNLPTPSLKGSKSKGVRSGNGNSLNSRFKI